MRLSERGWHVVVDARGAEALEHAVAGLAGVIPVTGDVADPDHRRLLVEAAGEPIDLLVNNASALGPTPCRSSRSTRSKSCGACTRRTCSHRSRSFNSACPLVGARAHRQCHLRRGRRGVQTWGGYGSSKAALTQITAVLAAEHPALRVYAVDPGDMRTQMQQDAFPGEDISDRPLPEESIPGFLTLIEGDLPSGLYRARDLVGAAA